MDRASSVFATPWRLWPPVVFSLALLLAIALLGWAIDRTEKQRRELEAYLEVSASAVVGKLASSIEGVLGTGDGTQVEAMLPPEDPLAPRHASRPTADEYVN